MSRLGLVTGASGYVGGRLVPALLDAGWRVRVLARNPGKLPEEWRGRVEITEGDLSDDTTLDEALSGAEAAWYLVHSMDGDGDFAARDRSLAQGFAAAAARADVRRIVYLSGLHPENEQLSEHLDSRVEVGRILLAGAVPTAVLQAGVVLGDGSASYLMLRHLTERLPVAIGPKWLRNHIQPIAVDDVIHYLVAAADLPPDSNRTFDIGMDEALTYVDMMKRYARITGLRERRMGIVPVLTPELASYWVGLVTPVPAGVARPLVGSLIHDAVAHEQDARDVMGVPDGGLIGYDEAVRRAAASYDPRLWGRTAARTAAAVSACALLGSLLTAPDSPWYRSLRKPSWQPPKATFPIVWTILYAAVGTASAAAYAELSEKDGVRRTDEAAGEFARALGVNLVLNAAWSGVFFRGHRLRTATVTAALLAASSVDLTRRAAPTGPGKTAGLGAYAAWTTFATVLTGEVARLNRHR